MSIYCTLYLFCRCNFIITFQFLDYYRPRYFILENVRDFVNFEKNAVLKLCMHALTKIGYQCSFGILQAGHYGIPQTRRRFILLAAAPGEILPMHPEPTNVFCPGRGSLTVNVDGKPYTSNCTW